MVGVEPVYKRFSFLKRQAAHSPSSFSAHYEQIHGPLAAAQNGFRKHTIRYVQNHVENPPDEGRFLFDGITVTEQVPRLDYTKGFFSEPDYANVKADEAFLFDIGSTVSVLGREEVVIGGRRGGAKVVALLRAGGSGHLPEGLPGRGDGVDGLILNWLDVANASALGFGRSSFAADLAVEMWFATPLQRKAASAALRRLDGVVDVMPVREVVIFGPEKPWSEPIRRA